MGVNIHKLLSMGKTTVLLLIVFAMGATAGSISTNSAELSLENPLSAITGPFLSLKPYITGNAVQTIENSIPKDRIREDQIRVYSDKVIIEDLENAAWSKFTDSNSMLNVIDFGANTIRVPIKSIDDVQIGDIISYTPENDKDITIIHRVVEKGEDEKGPYVRAKGDNLPIKDPYKIRPDWIKGVVIAIIY